MASANKGLAWGLAVVLPLVVVWAGLMGMERFRSHDDAREQRNAGKVINGRVVHQGVRETIEANLDRNEPDIVILGNSLSNTDIVATRLADALGLPRNKVQKISVPNSIGAHWYAILKNRVYGGGHLPALVLVHSDLQSLLAVTPRSEASYLNLSVHLDPVEPEIDAKLGARIYLLERVRENRGHVRERTMTLARNRIVDLLVYRSWRPTNRRDIERSLDRVFDDGQVDMGLHNNVIPAYNQGLDDLVPFDPESLPLPADSFLPEIASLVNRYGGTVIFVRPPMSPLLHWAIGDRVLPGVEEQAAAIARSEGGRTLDLTRLDMDSGHFFNLDHMRPEGARRFTEILADTLVDVGAWPRPDTAKTIDLLDPITIHGDWVVPARPEVTFRRAPPPIRGSRRPFRRRNRMVYFMTEALESLSDLTTLEITRHARRCSPIRVLEDEVPLPIHNVTCDEANRRGAGRVCHTFDRVWFSPADGTNPFANGRDYRMVLDPGRTCEGARWIYPRDHMRIVVASLPEAVEGLEVEIVDPRGDLPDGDVPAEIRVQLRAHQAVRLDARVGIGPATLSVDPPIAPGDRLAVDVINKSDDFLLLTNVALVTSSP